MSNYQINPENNLGRKMRTVQFFNLYFANFKYIFLANIYYLVFFVIAAAYVYLTFILCGGLNIIAALGAVVFLNIGMAGVTPICRYIYTEKEFPPFVTFIKGLKENIGRFVIHGIFFYLFSAISYASITLYYNGTKSNALFWVPLVITGLISLFVLFASYYLNIMTVTMDIGLKDIYRNCALFSFGELKNNLFVTIALIVLSAVMLAAAIIVNSLLYILIICGILTALFIPATVQYIITFYVYDAMVEILDQSRKHEEEDKPVHVQQEIKEEEAEEISRLAPDTNDEYIFHNGKMIKRSAVEEQLRESRDNLE